MYCGGIFTCRNFDQTEAHPMTQLRTLGSLDTKSGPPCRLAHLFANHTRISLKSLRSHCWSPKPISRARVIKASVQVKNRTRVGGWVGEKNFKLWCCLLRDWMLILWLHFSVLFGYVTPSHTIMINNGENSIAWEIKLGTNELSCDFFSKFLNSTILCS